MSDNNEDPFEGPLVSFDTEEHCENGKSNLDSKPASPRASHIVAVQETFFYKFLFADNTLLDVVGAWAGGCSIHGLPFVFASDIGVTKRLLWTVVVIWVTTMLALQANDLLTLYNSNPYSTQVSYVREQYQTLPTLTVCHNGKMPADFYADNPEWPTEPITNDELYENVIVQDIEPWSPSDDDSLPMEEVIAPGTILSIIPLSCALHGQVSLPGRAAGENPSCTMEFKSTPHGRCLQVTPKRPSSAESDTLRLKIYSPIRMVDVFETVGLRVFVHPEGTNVTMSTPSALISPNQKIQIGVFKEEISLLEAPFEAGCVRGAQRPEECQQDCLYREVRESCGCRAVGDVDEQVMAEFRICDFMDSSFQCGEGPVECDRDCEARVNFTECARNCATPCKIDYFSLESSSTQWINVFLSDNEADDQRYIYADLANKSEPYDFATQWASLLEIPGEFYMNSSMALNDIYSIEVNWKTMLGSNIQQVADYPDVTSILSAIGGLAGFWTGYSIVSFVEVLDLIFLRILTRCCGIRKMGGIGSKSTFG